MCLHVFRIKQIVRIVNHKPPDKCLMQEEVISSLAPPALRRRAVILFMPWVFLHTIPKENRKCFVKTPCTVLMRAWKQGRLLLFPFLLQALTLFTSLQLFSAASSDQMLFAPQVRLNGRQRARFPKGAGSSVNQKKHSTPVLLSGELEHFRETN